MVGDVVEESDDVLIDGDDAHRAPRTNGVFEPRKNPESAVLGGEGEDMIDVAGLREEEIAWAEDGDLAAVPVELAGQALRADPVVQCDEEQSRPRGDALGQWHRGATRRPYRVRLARSTQWSASR